MRTKIKHESSPQSDWHVLFVWSSRDGAFRFHSQWTSSKAAMVEATIQTNLTALVDNAS